MAFTFPTNNINNNFHDDNTFHAVINRLKAQNALPNHCFLKDIPFFNIPSLPKEVQMKEIFENACDINQCRTLLKSVVPLQNGDEYKILPQNYSPISVMSFSQITLYKVLPCPHAQCANYPREIATHNQYKDFEYQCPFYHHERDRRRIVVSVSADEEFVYKANYYEEGRRNGDKEKYSQNYFESMFHPLYYKMFRCKRDFCNTSAFCPFFHSEDEKRTWDDIFCGFIGKDRVTYIKDKQASPSKKAKGPQQLNNRRKRSDEDEAAKENHGYFANHFNGKFAAKNHRAHFQQPDQAMQFDMMSNSTDRKDSEDSSFEEKYDRYGFFGRLQAVAKGY